MLLQQFAYKPILKVLEERRQRIAEGLLNAEKIKSNSPKRNSATRRFSRKATAKRRR